MGACGSMFLRSGGPGGIDLFARVGLRGRLGGWFLLWRL